MDKLSPSKAWGYPKAMFFSLFILRNINGRPHRVAPTASGQAALRSDFRNENQSHAPLFLLFREKSRLRMLCVCKRTHNAFAALPTFHGIYGERKRLKIIKSRGVYVAFYTSMRVETACRFVSQGKWNLNTYWFLHANFPQNCVKHLVNTKSIHCGIFLV